MKVWQIAVVDNHPVWRAGLKLVLNDTVDFTVIAEAESGHQAIEVCQKSQPDIVLMDVNMPNGNGIEATQVLHSLFPGMIIIAISGFWHEEIQKEVLRAGAVGYISKESEFDEMIRLIRAITDGYTVRSSARTDQFHLTNMEYKMLCLLAEGKDRQEIADLLIISINTVKMHFRNLYQKLGVDNANDAIKTALQFHLIS